MCYHVELEASRFIPNWRALMCKGILIDVSAPYYHLGSIRSWRAQ